jgi:predicted transcriptional regulator with HTH domain
MNYPTSFYITEQDLRELRILSETITIKRRSKIVKLKRTRLRKNILEFIASNDSICAPDLCEKFRFSKANRSQHSNARKYLRNLNKLELIKEMDQQQKTLIKKETSNKKKYYKLTSKGIYYMLSKNRDLPYGVLKAILERYDNHILFKLFVYPYVGRSTLLQIIDSFIFALLCRYLNDCCKRIQEMFKSIDNTYNSKSGYLTDQLCIWKWSMIQTHYVLS